MILENYIIPKLLNKLLVCMQVSYVEGKCTYKLR